MKHKTAVARVTEAEAGLERIRRLGKQLEPGTANRGKRRALSAALRIETDRYRKILDAEQATATHDAKPQLGVGLGFLNCASRTPTPRRTIHSPSRSAPRH